MFKPVMPVLVDKLAHSFWQNVHLATVHKHNGKEHVHYELRKLDKEEGSNKAGNTIKWDFEQSQHLLTAFAWLPRDLVSTGQRQDYWDYASKVACAYQLKDYPPPKA